ncbi:MAG: hypothetical protein ACRDZO_28155 [Egibacteraceae bacterium]
MPVEAADPAGVDGCDPGGPHAAVASHNAAINAIAERFPNIARSSPGQARASPRRGVGPTAGLVPARRRETGIAASRGMITA